MKKLFIITAIFISINAYSQWYPTPNNPWKWYTVIKDTSVNNIPISSFAVQIAEFQVYYKCFELDSLNRPTSSPAATTIVFNCYANRSSAICGETKNQFYGWSKRVTIDGIPFEPDSEGLGGIGIKADVNVMLAEVFNVSINDIIE